LGIDIAKYAVQRCATASHRQSTASINGNSLVAFCHYPIEYLSRLYEIPENIAGRVLV
jgi:hypothetical protein